MKILVFGATSAIAKSAARIYAERNAQLFLIGRDEERLKKMKIDLELRGADSVEILTLDKNLIGFLLAYLSIILLQGDVRLCFLHDRVSLL